MGHAIQDAKDYAPLRIRYQLLPALQIGSFLGPWLFIIGFIIGMFGLAKLGLILFGTVALFQFVTLPVEFDASRRALVNLREMNLLSRREMPGAQAVLSAAAMTYVAALAMALAQILQYAAILGSARRD